MEASEEKVIDEKEPGVIPETVLEEIVPAWTALDEERKKLEAQLEPLNQTAAEKRQEASDAGESAVEVEQKLEKIRTLQSQMEQTKPVR